jgi:putative aldouronate transport system substrate-binding protein
MVMAAYNTAMTNARPAPVIIPSSPLKVAGPLNQTLQDKAKAFYIQSIIAPSADFDRVWDSSVADWMNSGGESVRAERAEKYVSP